MKSPLAIAVEPLLWNRLPLVMPVILKCVTSVLSVALRLSTRPLVVWVAGIVLALVTDGVSATPVTVTARFSVRVLVPPPPVSTTVQVMLPVPLASATVLYLRPANSAAVTVLPAATAVLPSLLNRVTNAGMAVTV